MVVVFGRGQDYVCSICFLKYCGGGIEIADCIFEESLNEPEVYCLNSLLMNQWFIVWYILHNKSM